MYSFKTLKNVSKYANKYPCPSKVEDADADDIVVKEDSDGSAM